jgi:hypothetical protein
MPLFGRRAARAGEGAAGDGADDTSELGRYALGRSWRPLGPAPFPELDAVIHDAVRAWYGLLEYQPLGGAQGGIVYRDAFGGGFPRAYESPLAPREFRCAHAWTVLNTRIPASICLLTVGTSLPEAVVGLRPHYSVMHAAPEVTVDDVDFTTRFEVRGPEPERVRALLVPEVRDRLMARDDWMTVFKGSAVLSVCFAAFDDGPDVDKRIEQLADLVAQFPQERGKGREGEGEGEEEKEQVRRWQVQGGVVADGEFGDRRGGGPEGVSGAVPEGVSEVVPEAAVQEGVVQEGAAREGVVEVGAEGGASRTALDENAPLFTAEQRAHFAAEVRRRRASPSILRRRFWL